MTHIPSAFDTYLFDLDGTLVDSIPDLTTSINLLRHELGLGSLGEESVRSYVGDGVGLLVQRALPQELFSPARRERFIEIYTEHLTDRTFVYPGIVDFLEMHPKVPKAVITNKLHHLAEQLLDRLELTPYFDYIIGAEIGQRKKPSPDMLNLALQKLDAEPGRAIMFGDHHVDLRAARAAGIGDCFCAWGLGHDDGLACEYRAETTADLVTLFPPVER